MLVHDIDGVWVRGGGIGEWGGMIGSAACEVPHRVPGGFTPKCSYPLRRAAAGQQGNPPAALAMALVPRRRGPLGSGPPFC